jgi:hypothetical protein
MKIKILTIAFCLVSISFLMGQDFLEGSHTFSSKKESYITLQNGTEVTGFIDDIDRKKGLIEEIVLKDKDGKKIKLKPEQVKHMYIAPSGFDKLSNANAKMYNATKWEDDKSAHAAHMKEGYVFFESTDVMIKKEKMKLLLQLINPGFANKIKVYLDPYASETGGLAFGGIQVTGGDAKSYYFKKGDAVAFKLQKKNYDEEWENLYGDCPALKKEFAKKMGWSEVERHVYYYSENCK